jgi:hypothetical protein
VWLWAGRQLRSSAASLSVRGDGATALVVTAADTSAVSVSAAAAGFTQTVVAVSTTKAAAADFSLLRVGAAAGGVVGVTGVAAWAWTRCGGHAWCGLTGWRAARLPERARVAVI